MPTVDYFRIGVFTSILSMQGGWFHEISAAENEDLTLDK